MNYQTLYTMLKAAILAALPAATNRVFLPHESRQWTGKPITTVTSSSPLIQIVDAQGLTLALSGAASTFALSFDILGTREDVEVWAATLNRQIFNHPRNPTPYTMLSPPTPETLPDNKLRVRFMVRVTTKPEAAT